MRAEVFMIKRVLERIRVFLFGRVVASRPWFGCFVTVAVLLFLGFGFVVLAPMEAVAQGRGLALAGPAGISTERPLCESILRSLNAEPFRGSPDWRRADLRFVTWQFLRIETIPPGGPYEKYAPNNLIEVVSVDIFNEGKPRNVYRVTSVDPVVNSFEEFLFFMNNEDDPLPMNLGSGRGDIEALPREVIEVETLVFGEDFVRRGPQREFQTTHPVFPTFTGRYFYQNFHRGLKYHRSNPDAWIDLIVTEEGRTLSVLETGNTVMIIELQGNQAQPVCYFAPAQEERVLEVVGPDSGNELDTTCVKIASVLNQEIQDGLINPRLSRSRILGISEEAQDQSAGSLFLKWRSAYHGKWSPFEVSGSAALNLIGPNVFEAIERVETTILNEGVIRRVFRFTEHSSLSSIDMFSQHLIFETDNPDGIAGAPPGEPIWWFRHFAGRGIYRDVDAHYFGPMRSIIFRQGDFGPLLEKYPPHSNRIGQDFHKSFGSFPYFGVNGNVAKEFDLIRLEDGRVLVLIEQVNRDFGNGHLPLAMILELRPDRAIPVCYLG
jgi:hypothetical protein